MKWNLRVVACSALAVVAATAAFQNGAQARGTAQSIVAETIETNNAVGRAPKTVEVKMMSVENVVSFDPKEIKLVVGDTVKWTLVGGRHNVEFWPDSVPAGALPLLRAAMKDTVAPLQSPRLQTAGNTYTIVFAGMPKGTYKYFCRPHLMRMMVGSLIIE